MSYLGNAPARSFISFERQVFTIVNSQTAYALSHSVTNENDIRLVINNVVQEPGSGKAYTATGTALTLSAALTNGTDEMYCVFLGRATATSAPGAGSIGTAQLAADAVTNAKIADDAISDEQLDPTVITGQTAETSIATDDLILLSDTSASGALRKMTRANFVSGVGGDNTPSFSVTLSSNQTGISNATWTKLNFASEYWDTDSAFASNKFTVPSGEDGKYYFGYTTRVTSIDDAEQVAIKLYKNGSPADTERSMGNSFVSLNSQNVNVSGFYAISASASDYFEVYVYHDEGGNQTAEAGASIFFGYKLIGV